MNKQVMHKARIKASGNKVVLVVMKSTENEMGLFPSLVVALRMSLLSGGMGVNTNNV